MYESLPVLIAIITTGRGQQHLCCSAAAAATASGAAFADGFAIHFQRHEPSANSWFAAAAANVLLLPLENAL